MRYSILFLLILFNVSFISEKKEKQFNQDVATIHSLKQGLPDGEIDKITVQKDEVFATIKNGTYSWDGSSWKSIKYVKEKSPGIPTLPPGSKVLSSTPRPWIVVHLSTSDDSMRPCRRSRSTSTLMVSPMPG